MTKDAIGNVKWFSKEELQKIFPEKTDFLICEACGGGMKIGKLLDEGQTLYPPWVFECADCKRSLLPAPKPSKEAIAFNLMKFFDEDKYLHDLWKCYRKGVDIKKFDRETLFIALISDLLRQIKGRGEEKPYHGRATMDSSLCGRSPAGMLGNGSGR